MSKFVMVRDGPCYGYPDRHEACLGECDRYRAWKAQNERDSAARRQWRAIDYYLKRMDDRRDNRKEDKR